MSKTEIKKASSSGKIKTDLFLKSETLRLGISHDE